MLCMDYLCFYFTLHEHSQDEDNVWTCRHADSNIPTFSPHGLRSHTNNITGKGLAFGVTSYEVFYYSVYSSLRE